MDTATAAAPGTEIPMSGEPLNHSHIVSLGFVPVADARMTTLRDVPREFRPDHVTAYWDGDGTPTGPVTLSSVSVTGRAILRNGHPGHNRAGRSWRGGELDAAPVWVQRFVRDNAPRGAEPC
jgi:hypothetical protein